MRKILLLALFVIISQPALALSPEEEAFTKAYIAAINSKDRAAHEKLIASETLACINDKNKDFFDQVLANAQRNTIPDNAKVEITEGNPAGMAFFSPDFFTIPITPTHQMKLDYTLNTPGKISSVTALIMLTKKDGQLYEVIACPTEAGIERIHKVAAENEKHKKELQEKADNMEPALKAQLKTMLDGGHEIDAIKLYREKTDASLVDATDIVNLLSAKKGK